ncbi:MAG: hypothetical protein IPM39_09740 [Chloroflexi bacterium]|nr:hypothetical protein [Chloroflexota bacterium]
MNRTKGILAAGTLTGLVLITLLALGFGNLRAAGGSTTAVPTTTISTTTTDLPLPETGSLTNEEALQAWQEYSVQLEQTVRTMQERETVYQAQLDAANQTILQLQNDINSANANSAPAFTGGDDNGEHEEHEEHEHEEYDDD